MTECAHSDQHFSLGVVCKGLLCILLNLVCGDQTLNFEVEVSLGRNHMTSRRAATELFLIPMRGVILMW